MQVRSWHCRSLDDIEARDSLPQFVTVTLSGHIVESLLEGSFERIDFPRHTRALYVTAIACLAHGLKQHNELIRCCVATAGNDHRLGAQEALAASQPSKLAVIFRVRLGIGVSKPQRVAQNIHRAPQRYIRIAVRSISRDIALRRQRDAANRCCPSRLPSLSTCRLGSRFVDPTARLLQAVRAVCEVNRLPITSMQL